MWKYLRKAAGVAALMVASASPVALSAQNALAQPRTIRFVNPYPPGGTGDIIARVITEQINRTRGVTFVIEDRPGAGTVIGADVVARSAPNGSTLLLNTSSLFISAHLRKLNFDTLTAFEPICISSNRRNSFSSMATRSMSPCAISSKRRAPNRAN
jgi:tripartite-type tricarboxylate transporter receptor subunit TctC